MADRKRQAARDLGHSYRGLTWNWTLNPCCWYQDLQVSFWTVKWMHGIIYHLYILSCALCLSCVHYPHISVSVVFASADSCTNTFCLWDLFPLPFMACYLNHSLTIIHHLCSSCMAHCVATLLLYLMYSMFVAYNTCLYNILAVFIWVFPPCRTHPFGSVWVFPWSVQGQYRPKSVVTCDSRFGPWLFFSCTGFCEL